MRTSCVKKGLVVGIIVLFLGVSIVSSFSSRSISSHFEMLLEHGAESDENGKPGDDYNEIISTVRGTGKGASWRWQVIPILILDLYLHQGKYYINCFTRDPLKLFYHAKAKSIRMKTFIGIAVMTPDYVNTVIGIAIGDITWEPYE